MFHTHFLTLLYYKEERGGENWDTLRTAIFFSGMRKLWTENTCTIFFLSVAEGSIWSSLYPLGSPCSTNSNHMSACLQQLYNHTPYPSTPIKLHNKSSRGMSGEVQCY